MARSAGFCHLGTQPSRLSQEMFTEIVKSSAIYHGVRNSRAKRYTEISNSATYGYISSFLLLGAAELNLDRPMQTSPIFWLPLSSSVYERLTFAVKVAEGFGGRPHCLRQYSS